MTGRRTSYYRKGTVSPTTGWKEGRH